VQFHFQYQEVKTDTMNRTDEVLLEKVIVAQLVKEFFCFLRNSKLRCRVYKNQPLGPN